MAFTGGGWVIEDPADRDRPSKIIDAHYHIFPRLGSQRSGIDPKLRLKCWQYHSREWNNFWREEDGKHTTEQFLLHDGGDVDLVVIHQGGDVACDIDGDTVSIQTMWNDLFW